MNKKFKIILILALLLTVLVIHASAQGVYVGSKNSNKYHYPDCYWATQIKDSNEVWFSSAQDAVNQGYEPCSVCDPPLPTSQNTIIVPEDPQTPSTDICNVFVSDVIDGDTFDTSEGFRVRLADIDAPEISESGYAEATQYLQSLIEEKIVTLDIDSDTGTDIYGRYVCLVYAVHNSSHFLNVNQALLTEGFATVSDYTNNEFSPSTWKLYSEITAIPEFPSWMILPMVMMGTLAVIQLRKKMKK